MRVADTLITNEEQRFQQPETTNSPECTGTEVPNIQNAYGLFCVAAPNSHQVNNFYGIQPEEITKVIRASLEAQGAYLHEQTANATAAPTSAAEASDSPLSSNLHERASQASPTSDSPKPQVCYDAQPPGAESSVEEVFPKQTLEELERVWSKLGDDERRTMQEYCIPVTADEFVVFSCGTEGIAPYLPRLRAAKSMECVHSILREMYVQFKKENVDVKELFKNGEFALYLLRSLSDKNKKQIFQSKKELKKQKKALQRFLRDSLINTIWK